MTSNVTGDGKSGILGQTSVPGVLALFLSSSRFGSILPRSLEQVGRKKFKSYRIPNKAKCKETSKCNPRPPAEESCQGMCLLEKR